MENVIIVGILVILVGTAVFYMRKEKKKGTRCIGCPSAGCCAGKGCGNRIHSIDIRKWQLLLKRRTLIIRL
ncbi:MAG: FeoB-associated Cys-rich membrane protein [Clostridiales bacterium]|nr:FeoB-associated Cys-rich membrane protein [Clostridiales bacterium]